MTKTGDPRLQVNQFADVIKDKKIKEFGIHRADVVMVVAYKNVPASRSDPYLTRTLVVAAKMEQGNLLLPDQDNDYQTYLIDPRNLEFVGDERQAYYEGLLNEQFGA